MRRLIAYASCAPIDARPFLGRFGWFCEYGNLPPDLNKHKERSHPDGWAASSQPLDIAYRCDYREWRLLENGELFDLMTGEFRFLVSAEKRGAKT